MEQGNKGGFQKSHGDRPEERERKEWEQVNFIVSEDGTLGVTITKLPLFRPVYTIQVGTPVKGEKRVTRNLSVRTEGKGKIVLTPVNTEALVALILKAQEWILQDRQTREDEIIHTAQEREARRGIPDREFRKTGKTERNREKRRSHRE